MGSTVYAITESIITKASTVFAEASNEPFGRHLKVTALACLGMSKDDRVAPEESSI